MIHYLQMFGVSLGLTLVVELIVFLCFQLRRREQILLAVLVNLLTNPAAVWLHHFLGIPQIPIEILVVITECYVYHTFRQTHRISNPLLLSLTANAASWGLGVLIQQF